jgi:hypothetical protein
MKNEDHQGHPSFIMVHGSWWFLKDDGCASLLTYRAFVSRKKQKERKIEMFMLFFRLDQFD